MGAVRGGGLAVLQLGKVLLRPVVGGDAQGDAGAAVGEGQAAGHGAVGDGVLHVDLFALNAHAVAGIQVALGLVAGAGGKLLDGVEDHVAGALAGHADLVLILAQSGHGGGGVEEAGGEQVGVGGVGGVLAADVDQLGDHAAVGLLLPFDLGVFLLELGDFLGVALDQLLDHAFGVHTAGQAADGVFAVVETAYIAAAYAAERCHNDRSFSLKI